MNWKLHGMKFYDSYINVAFLLTLILCGGSFFCGGGGLTRKDDILLLQLKNFIVKLHKIAAALSLCVCVMWPGGCGCTCLYYLSICCLSY